jgi:hypothetical protein
MRDIDTLTRALRELPVHDVDAGKSRSILAVAQATLARHDEKQPSLFDILWARFVAPTLVTATVASYLVWAMTAAGALYR